MIEIIVLLIIGLPLIVIGKLIGPDTPIIFGTKNPQLKLEGEKGIKGLKRIKIALMLAGVITLAVGMLGVIFDWTELIYWIMFVPATIAVVYMLLQLCMLHKDKKKGIIITVVSIALIISAVFLMMLPMIGIDSEPIIKNDTLFIGGSYSRVIPLSNITYVNGDATVPSIEMRTNGISFGTYNIGHFRTKDQKDVLLYLHSDETNVTHIKTRYHEELFINFKDAAKSIEFPSKLKKKSRYPSDKSD